MNTHTPITPDSKPVLAWDGLSRPTIERTKRWYVTAAAVVVLAAMYGIFTGSWSFAIVSVLAGGMYALIHDHRPTASHIELHDSGVLYDANFLRWDQLAGFWFLHTRDYTELRLVPRGARARLVIQTGNLDLAQLRMILGQRLPEMTHARESLIDILLRVCKL